MSPRERLVRLLAAHSYQEGHFVLASGAVSNVYLDAKQVSYRPEGQRLVGEGIHALMGEVGAVSVGGLTMGADTLVAAAVHASFGTPHPVTGFSVRKEAKGHGLGKWIEGVAPSGLRVAMVDDVITSGGSLLQAVERTRELGAQVVLAVGMVDRGQGGAEAIEAAGIPFRALATLEEVREAYRVAARL